MRVDPKKAAKAMVGGMRGGVPGVVASAAAAAIVGAIDGVIEDGVVKVPTVQEVDPGPTGYFWYHNSITAITSKPSATSVCQAVFSTPGLSKPHPNDVPSSYSSVRVVDTQFRCDITFQRPSTGEFITVERGRAIRDGNGCPQGTSYNSIQGRCEMSGLGSPTEQHWITAEQWASVRDSDFVRDMVRASCEGSNAPGRCYDEMSEWGDLQGPASQTGPAQVTTTTKTNPDGTTSTTTTTTQNRYEYNFGPNYYNYSTTTKITQNTDGVVTETETTDGMPTDTPTHEEESTDYTFNDTDFPEVPSFYERKYPDGLEGVWQQASADVDHSDFIQFLRGFVPSFSGSCPAFGLGFNIASWANYGTVQFSSICYVLDFVKIILLVTALFTFRKVTFGG